MSTRAGEMLKSPACSALLLNCILWYLWTPFSGLPIHSDLPIFRNPYLLLHSGPLGDEQAPLCVILSTKMAGGAGLEKAVPLLIRI